MKRLQQAHQEDFVIGNINNLYMVKSCGNKANELIETSRDVRNAIAIF
jgi:hypothetical protein